MSICNAVFEGGGVKGIGHVGVVSALEQAGYEFDVVAGSSAGAIVAALIAAGYRGETMHEIMRSLDYRKFRQTDWLDRLGNSGRLFSILLHYGIYQASYVEQWLHELLLAKHTAYFRDVKKADGTYRLYVTTVDLTAHRLLVLPDDLIQLGIDPDSFSLARAVRMSMSIPIYYEPYTLKDGNGVVHYLVDGGLVSNYPIGILDDGKQKLLHPTFGLKFTSQLCDRPAALPKVHHLLDYMKLMISTLLDAYENDAVSSATGDRQRSILISSLIHDQGGTKAISVTDFDLTQAESEALYENGIHAAKAFLADWNFARWQRIYRRSSNR